jgi:hypothetical protein
LRYPPTHPQRHHRSRRHLATPPTASLSPLAPPRSTHPTSPLLLLRGWRDTHLPNHKGDPRIRAAPRHGLRTETSACACPDKSTSARFPRWRSGGGGLANPLDRHRSRIRTAQSVWVWGQGVSPYICRWGRRSFLQATPDMNSPANPPRLASRRRRHVFDSVVGELL